MPKVPTEPELHAMWMVKELHSRNGYLHQRVVVHRLREVSPKFVRRNRTGGWAIDPAVLEAFRRYTEKETVWSRSRLRWRPRTDRDKPGVRGVR